MQALLYDQFNGPLRMAQVADPTPEGDGVVIEVRATGLCRSDWHGWQGHDADIRTLPHVPGHELAGVVAEVGSQVTNWRPGDRVTMPFVAGCGACGCCARGDHHVCDHQFQPGFTGWGSFAQLVAVRYADVNLVRLPESMEMATAAALGCRLATAYRAVAIQSSAAEGDWLAVFGCGGVGLSAIMVARALGVRTIGVDIAPQALRLARQFGAEQTLDASSVDDIPAAIHEITQAGADASIDALGSAATAADSINSLRKRGRHVQVGLLAGVDAAPPLPMGRVIGWELEIVGSHGLQAHVYPELLKLVTAGKIPAEQLVARMIDLSAAGDALAAMDAAPSAGVTVIKP